MKTAILSLSQSCPMEMRGFCNEVYVCAMVDCGVNVEGKARCEE